MYLSRRDESGGVDGDDDGIDDDDVDDDTNDGYVTCTCQGGMKAVVWTEMMLILMMMMLMMILMMDTSRVLVREG